MNEGNGHGRIPVEVLDMNYPRIIDLPPPPEAPRRRELWLPLILFLLTVVSTLIVGVEFGRSYAANQEPFSGDSNLLAMMLLPFRHPAMFVLGIPFSFTLLAILFAHEMGHFFACRIYGIDASYPYFIPAPTLFGTFGAFIRIRSPIATRRALFDVGLAGPVVGFLIAAPAMVWGIATSKIVPDAQEHAVFLFGHPALERLLVALFHPHLDPNWLLLNPVGRAAWVGLFVTALNLLPAWQLDGGHIMYSLTSARHAKISLGVALVLLGLGIYAWHGWATWGVILLILSLRFRHPPVWDRWQPLDSARRAWAAVALVIFVLCFTLWPVMTP
ncbi:MAG TPA: site-2 protease family protein [Candidatus Acidoferrales bacterium]|nr:site-2 protease family protein [Candidatus Acidoferrales bacterium]